MEGLRLYNQLLLHPLFQGMSRDDLGKVIAHTKFDFRKYDAGHAIAKEYDPCRQMLFLLNGTVAITGTSDDHSYRIEEEAKAPWLLPIENLFGLHQHYTRTFIAASKCHLIGLDKNEVLHLVDEFVVFRFNLLNILTTLAQKKERALWQSPPDSLETRTARFLSARCLIPSGTKTFHIKMTRIAEELNDSRLDISRALNRMQEQGLLTLHRGRIHIPSIEALACL